MAKSLQKRGNFAGKFLPEGDLIGGLVRQAAEYVLFREGRVVPLSPKVYETLLVLVENSGHVVAKDELYKQVWQDAFVEETNLTKNISILRKILSEGDGERSFIETVPKRGYRFVVPVRKCDSEDSENGSKSAASLSSNGVDKSTDSSLKSASKPTEIDLARPTSSAEYIFSQIKTHKYGFAGLLGIATLLIVGVGFGLYKLAFQKKTGISLASTQITRLTSSGNAIKAAISADGKWIVYVEYDGEHQSLWLKQVAVPGRHR